MGQLDPGFTGHGFAVDLLIQLLSVFVGTIGALAVAWFLYRRQRTEERADFEESLAHERDLFKQSLAHDRQLFQENLANDRKIRRDEDRVRRRERDKSERRERLNVLEALFTECSLNKDAIGMMAKDEAHQFPLRHQALDQALTSLDSLPPDLSTQLLRLSFYRSLQRLRSGEVQLPIPQQYDDGR